MAKKTTWLVAGIVSAFIVVVLGGILAGVGASRSTGSAAQATGQSSAPVTADRAAILAIQAAPGAILQGMPDLVRYQGRLAYETPLDRGTVYIDAENGAILANSAKTPPVIAAGATNASPSATTSFNSTRRNETRPAKYGEHREHDDDDD